MIKPLFKSFIFFTVIALVSACGPSGIGVSSTTTPVSPTSTAIPLTGPQEIGSTAALTTPIPPFTKTLSPTLTFSKTATSTPTQPSCLSRANFGEPSESDYILPYPVGFRYEVDQSYCQVYSSHSNQLAYDFAMEFGDEVTAARAGRVWEVVDTYGDDDTNSSHFNYVFILHEDGTVAFYAHLMQNSVLVHVSDTGIVEAGHVIAQVGHSGMPADYRSVLHFGVYASWPPREGSDLPINFRNAGGSLDSRNGLALGRYYKALPYAIIAPE